MILADCLVKHYRVASRPPGLGAALRSVVRREYRDVHAVDDISFEIGQGERVGFLGPNGAGKTTTLKMLAGLLVPTAGRALVAGFTPHQRRERFLRSIMLVTGQKNQLIWDLPPADTFELNRAIFEVPRPDFEQRLGELVALLEIGDVINKPTRQLSLGERMKCELTAALLHQPGVLFLDEPTIGLDVAMQSSVRRFVRSYCDRHGATVLITSHNMADVARICDRVIAIDRGRLRFDGSLPELVQRVRPYKRVELRFGQRIEEEQLGRLGKVVEHNDTRAVIQVPHPQLKAAVESALQLPVSDLTVTDAPLEEVLVDLFRRPGQGGEGA